MILDGHDLSSIAAAARSLQAGELIGLPTETVYGLAADASNEVAVASIFAAKGRPADHPLIVHVAEPGDAQAFAREIPGFADRLMQAFWPGPLTLILPRRAGVGAVAAGGQDSIGLRCPSHPLAHAVLKAARELGVPGVAAPSANRFGRVSPTTAQHVQEEFGQDLLILDGGACEVGIESTIVDCSRGAAVVLRPGRISRDQIQVVCGASLLQQDDLANPAPRASGTLAAHYAPNARVMLMDVQQLQAALAKLQDGSAPGSLAVYARTALHVPASVILRTMPAAPHDAEHELFAVMRELDAKGVSSIWIEAPPDDLAWEGVRDRLSRAAA